MCCLRFTISASYRKDMERHLKTAQRLGHVRQVKYLLAILAVVEGQSFAQVALVLHVHEKTVATWVRLFCCYGLQGTPHRKPTGRPPKLTPTQKAALVTWIEEGPVKAGFIGGSQTPQTPQTHACPPRQHAAHTTMTKEHRAYTGHPCRRVVVSHQEHPFAHDDTGHD